MNMGEILFLRGSRYVYLKAQKIIRKLKPKEEGEMRRIEIDLVDDYHYNILQAKERIRESLETCARIERSVKAADEQE